MLDKKNRHLKFFSYKRNSFHKFFSLVGIHSRSGLIQKKKLGICRHSSYDLELSLLSVRKVRCKSISFSVKVKYFQKSHSFIINLLLDFFVSSHMKDSLKRAVFESLGKSDLNIVDNRHLLKKSDVLECSCYSRMINFYCVFSCYVFTVKLYLAFIWLIHACKKVEHRSFTGTVWSDKSVELTLFDCHIKIVNCAQSTEGNAQIGYI